MNTDMDSSNADEYYVTALQIFDYCGAESSGTLRVDALMDKFAPFIKTNKAEYSYLKSLLDPGQNNPEVNVIILAKALHKYSESQKCKVDLDESFNLRCGQAPHDSDSGISSDGFQLLEDLQSELREKAHLAHQLRNQLDFTDRQHEEVLATLTAERDSLRGHLNMLREENITLSHVRRDYEEACDRLLASERALDDARRELEGSRRRSKLLAEQRAALESEKLTLQELLTKSKDECHRINEMYASRQSALLEQNESLRAERAELAARLHDQEEVMQQLIKEKVLLEMELKDTVNKANQTPLRFDRSIDVSYCEDHALAALDSLTADSRFSPENRLLDEESFMNALKEDQGRGTNMSLFDEIRLSFNNTSRYSFTGNHHDDRCLNPFETSMTTVETQTDTEVDKITELINSETQTEDLGHICIPYHNIQTQTDDIFNNNNSIECINCSNCLECEKMKLNIDKLESDVRRSQLVVKETESELSRYEDNLSLLQKLVNDSNGRNSFLQAAVDSLQAKIRLLEAACASQKEILEGFERDMCCAQCQTDGDISSVGTQVEVPCADCEKRKVIAPHRSLRKYFWDALKVMFQVFAVVCFACAVCVLYAFARPRAACRDPVPWRWLQPQDIMDLFLRIEYVADVPM
ncbi:uncharacterized protein LOC114357519 isoform X1 [Ostrinia furnacalis]|uniref:uncharacterized protein LOC114357519 isoform X1 n=1 Tax=Ostrinia furnacalis TaxID=93504 RepID=UPI0010405D9F|nr:uncharacterized protein LOC114357519 isoform X1 [Ostrinia furnacalis]